MKTVKELKESLTSEKYSPNGLATLLTKEGFFSKLTGDAILKMQRPQGRLNESGSKKVFLHVEKDPGKNGRNHIYSKDFTAFYEELLK